jgi:hypothetical protein
MTARSLRALVGASDNLRELFIELTRSGQSTDAAIVQHCAEVLTAMLGRLVVSRTEQPECEVQS